MGFWLSSYEMDTFAWIQILNDTLFHIVQIPLRKGK